MIENNFGQPYRYSPTINIISDNFVARFVLNKFSFSHLPYNDDI